MQHFHSIIFQQEYWSGVPGPPPGDLADPGIEPMSLMSSALAGVQLATFPLFPHMTFPLCVYGDRERARARDLVTPPLIRMSGPLGLGPHSYTSAVALFACDRDTR